MKRLLLVLLIVGVFALGAASGSFAALIHWAMRKGKLAQAYQQALIWQFGSNAFTAYLEGPPDAGIYALNYHLRDLDNEQETWGTNQWSGVLNHWDMDRMRCVANARLAVLYEKSGRRDLMSNHLDLAWQSLQHFKRLPSGVTKKDDLIRFIKEKDARHEWP